MSRMIFVNQWKYRKLLRLTLFECTFSMESFWRYYGALIVLGIGVRVFGPRQ